MLRHVQHMSARCSMLQHNAFRMSMHSNAKQGPCGILPVLLSPVKFYDAAVSSS
jgi:hypothetical protein